MFAVLAGLFLNGVASAADGASCQIGAKDIIEALKAEESTGACAAGSSSAAVAGHSWKCYAKDSCGKVWWATRVCRDHAENAAVSECDSYTRDRGTCSVTDCCEVY
jgi:hypothetical protein